MARRAWEIMPTYQWSGRIATVLENKNVRFYIGRYLAASSLGEARLIGMVRWIWRRDGRFRLRLLAWVMQHQYEDRQLMADETAMRLAEVQRN